MRTGNNKDLTRAEIYKLFSRVGYPTPLNGLVSEVTPVLMGKEGGLGDRSLQQGPYKEPQVVVYLTPTATAGKDMILIPAQDALERFPGNYCSEYLHGGDNNSSSAIRLLQVGRRRWLLKCQSEDDWRANAGKCEVTVMFEQEQEYEEEMPFPVWAVDFIQIGRRGMMAVDLNLTPSLDPIKDILDFGEIQELIAEAQKHFKNTVRDE